MAVSGACTGDQLRGPLSHPLFSKLVCELEVPESLFKSSGLRPHPRASDSVGLARDLEPASLITTPGISEARDQRPTLGQRGSSQRLGHPGLQEVACEAETLPLRVSK